MTAQSINAVREFLCGGSGEVSPEARAELDDFKRWLTLPKPRPAFREWRAASREGPFMTAPVVRIAEHTALLREQTAFARGRCAALHELDLEGRELACIECRQRGAEVYPVAAPPSSERAP